GYEGHIGRGNDNRFALRDSVVRQFQKTGVLAFAQFCPAISAQLSFFVCSPLLTGGQTIVGGKHNPIGKPIGAQGQSQHEECAAAPSTHFDFHCLTSIEARTVKRSLPAPSRVIEDVNCASRNTGLSSSSFCMDEALSE